MLILLEPVASTMKIIFFFLLITSGNYFCDAQKAKKLFIAGGNFTRIEEVPYQASILIGKQVICGATIIHKYWVLTAGHCLDDYPKKKEYFVIRTGTDELYAYGDRHKINYVVVHPEYYIGFFTRYNDIALIKLKRPIKFNKKQKPIAIATPIDIPQEYQCMIISGFGYTGEDKPQPDYLLKGCVPVTSQEKCVYAYSILRYFKLVSDNEFCAGNGIVDACPGDSGGPGIINDKLYGIVSAGKYCPSQEYPGIYTRVHVYYNWIVQTTGIKF